MTRPVSAPAAAVAAAREPHDACVLGLDPSTTWTGYAVLRFSQAGCASFVDGGAFDAENSLKEYNRLNRTAGKKATTGDEARFVRIRHTAMWLCRRVFESYPVDLIAYEKPNAHRSAILAGHEAIGAYIYAIPYTVGLPIVPVNATTAKAHTIGSTFRKKGQTAETLNEKARMVEWARQNVSGFADAVCGQCREAQEAIADACSVAFAAWKRGLK